MIFIDQKVFEDNISVLLNRFACVSITKKLSNARLLVAYKLLSDGKLGKLLVVSKHLVDTNLFSVGKHLIDFIHLASIKILTPLTSLIYLPDITITGKLEYGNEFRTITSWFYYTSYYE